MNSHLVLKTNRKNHRKDHLFQSKIYKNHVVQRNNHKSHLCKQIFQFQLLQVRFYLLTVLVRLIIRVHVFYVFFFNLETRSSFFYFWHLQVIGLRSLNMVLIKFWKKNLWAKKRTQNEVFRPFSRLCLYSFSESLNEMRVQPYLN